MGPLQPVTRPEIFGSSDLISGFSVFANWANARAPVRGAEVFGPIDHAAGVCPGFGSGRPPLVVTRAEVFGMSDRHGRARPKNRARLTTEIRRKGPR